MSNTHELDRQLDCLLIATGRPVDMAGNERRRTLDTLGEMNRIFSRIPEDWKVQAYKTDWYLLDLPMLSDVPKTVVAALARKKGDQRIAVHVSREHDGAYLLQLGVLDMGSNNGEISLVKRILILGTKDNVEISTSTTKPELSFNPQAMIDFERLLRGLPDEQQEALSGSIVKMVVNDMNMTFTVFTGRAENEATHRS
jgi:hypothetical protein